ncbi:MAG: fluoride efflux transporter CrcB [Pseudonocardia sp.]
MTPLLMTPLLVVLGAGLGAPLRYLVDRVFRVYYGTTLPRGTFAVNVAGSALLGLLIGAAAPPPVFALVGTGFCGALTTYSTFGLETMQLAATGRRGSAVLNAFGSAAACLVTAGLGLALGASARN